MLLVVTPVAIVTVQVWYALSMAAFAVRVKVAAAVPGSQLLAVKAVLPHPLTTGVLKDAANRNVGSISAMLSLGVPVSNGLFRVKMNVTLDPANVDGLDTTSLLKVKTDTGAST